jgi:hypothetical protein
MYVYVQAGTYIVRNQLTGMNVCETYVHKYSHLHTNTLNEYIVSL